MFHIDQIWFTAGQIIPCYVVIYTPENGLKIFKMQYVL